MCSGSVPVLVALPGGWVPPFSSLLAFHHYGVRLDERTAERRLIPTLRSINSTERLRLQHNAALVCERFMGSLPAQMNTLLRILLPDNACFSFDDPVFDDMQLPDAFTEGADCRHGVHRPQA